MCRIRFNDPSVSRQHVRILVDYKYAIAEDLRSTTGSKENGEKLTHARSLADGDDLKIGNRILKVRVLPDAPPADSSEPDTVNEALDDANTEAEPRSVVTEAMRVTVPPPVAEPQPSLREMASMAA